MSEHEKAYTTKEVSLTLDIGQSTLRKWCLSLEENGYAFIRTDSNKRLFVEKDLVALKHYRSLIKEHNFTLENASMIIISRFNTEASKDRTPSVLSESEDEKRSNKRSDEKIERLLEYAERQERFNKQLIDRLDTQQKYIEKQQAYIEERLKERDENLIQSLRSVQETKQALLQIAAQKEDEKKKSFWDKILGR